MALPLYSALGVALGGAVGCLARWGVSRWLVPVSARLDFPLPTLVVNVLGAFLLGYLIKSRPLGDPTLGWAGVGFAGGFTTFSALAVELVALGERHTGRAALYLALSLGLGLGAAWLGMVLGNRTGG
ncbi:MAG: CrcB family protein [Bacteroidia bacterium]|nr:CrcB family protein [Bacteroidia bacterium]